uniref:Acetyl xylan esterase domain-containing protein n=1 Tax=Desulfobacca acetoxidans TaxID=60893 RepID=A0A7V4G8E6_9BACT
MAIEYLFWSPAPASTPSQSQSLVSPVLTMRATRSAQPVQNSGSKAFIDRKWLRARSPGAMAVASAASPCAKRRPPSSRAKAPAIFTVGFIDTTCPPSTVYAAYNALQSPKTIYNDVLSRHENTPGAMAATISGVTTPLSDRPMNTSAPRIISAKVPFTFRGFTRRAISDLAQSMPTVR